MPRTTALRTPTLLAVATLAAVAVSGCGGDDSDDVTTTVVQAPPATATQAAPTATGSTAADPATSTSGASGGTPVSGDDDRLTSSQARRVERAARRAQPGVVVSIDRDAADPTDDDADDRAETFSATVLSANGPARELVLSGGYRVLRRGLDDVDGLTYADAVRARRAALRAVPGTLVGLDTDDDGGSRYEATVLRANGRERTVRLDQRFSVVRSTPSDDGDDGDD